MGQESAGPACHDAQPWQVALLDMCRAGVPDVSSCTAPSNDGTSQKATMALSWTQAWHRPAHERVALNAARDASWPCRLPLDGVAAAAADADAVPGLPPAQCARLVIPDTQQVPGIAGPADPAGLAGCCLLGGLTCLPAACALCIA